MNHALLFYKAQRHSHLHPTMLPRFCILAYSFSPACSVVLIIRVRCVLVPILVVGVVIPWVGAAVGVVTEARTGGSSVRWEEGDEGSEGNR